MHCPKCPTRTLTASTVGPLQVDLCPGCGGVWCDAAELAQLLALDQAEAAAVRAGKLNPAANAQAGACPRDGNRMLRVTSARQRQVIIESCPHCHGIWLDGGELAQLLVAKP